MALGVQRRDDPPFCAGESLANTVVGPRDLASSSLAHLLDLVAEHDASTSSPTSRQILRVTMSLSPVRILTFTPARPARQSPRRRFPWADRGRRCSPAASGRVRPRPNRPSSSIGNLLVGDRDDAKPVLVERARLALRLSRDGSASSTPHSSIDLIVLADREHLLDRALANEDMLAVLADQDDRQAPAREIERYFVDLVIAGARILGPCRVRRAAAPRCRAGFSGRTDSGCSGRHIGGRARILHRGYRGTFEDDAVLRQRAGLVGAQDIHRAEILNGVEALDDDLLRDMAIAPLARLTVTIIGSISGVRPTATATANNSASSQSCLVKPLMRKTDGPSRG